MDRCYKPFPNECIIVIPTLPGFHISSQLGWCELRGNAPHGRCFPFSPDRPKDLTQHNCWLDIRNQDPVVHRWFISLSYVPPKKLRFSGFFAMKWPFIERDMAFWITPRQTHPMQTNPCPGAVVRLLEYLPPILVKSPIQTPSESL